MVSTMENDLKMVDGTWKVVPKEFPNWYGIEEIGFVWHGSWADPEIEYKGKRCSCFVVENTMWERFNEDCPAVDEDKFYEYMRERENDVIDLCELALFGKEI